MAEVSSRDVKVLEGLLQSERVRLRAVFLFGECQEHTVPLFSR